MDEQNPAIYAQVFGRCGVLKAGLDFAFNEGNYLLLKTWIVVQMAKPTTSVTVTNDANVPMKDI